MSSDIYNDMLRQQYLAHNGEDLLSQVQKVVCLITPKAMITAGYHPSGEVLIVNSCMHQLDSWDAAFIENELLNNNLFTTPEMVSCIFIGAEKALLIPDELFLDQETANSWLQKIYFCEAQESLMLASFPANKIHCSYAVDTKIKDLLEHYFNGATIMPLQMVHFKDKVTDVLQCTIMDSYAIATLHNGNNLLWQQTFEYHTAEDILYQLSAACQEFQLDIQEYLISFTSTSIENQPILKSLKSYFPNFKLTKSGIADIIAPNWSATVFLFQQLYGCAS
jgi:hypothetical protein